MSLLEMDLTAVGLVVTLDLAGAELAATLDFAGKAINKTATKSNSMPEPAIPKIVLILFAKDVSAFTVFIFFIILAAAVV